MSFKSVGPRVTEAEGNLVITLRILIACSLVFIGMVVINHSMISTLHNEEASPKVFVMNNIQKFEEKIMHNKIVNAGRENYLNKWRDSHKLDTIDIPLPKHNHQPIVPPSVIDGPLPPYKTIPPLTTKEKEEVKTLVPTDASNAVQKLEEPHDTLEKPVASGFHSLTCPHGELLQFWKPTTEEDWAYKTPYEEKGRTKYVTFEPDEGGWNNIRMQMELVLVFAYATGRTLVLPPDQPMYLLNKGKGHQKEHSFADFFPFDYIRQRMPVISMEQFLEREGLGGNLRNEVTGQVQFPPNNKTTFDTSGRRVRLANCWYYVRNVSACPMWKAMKEFVVIPPAPGVNVSHLPPVKAAEYQKRLDVFAAKRTPQYYDMEWHKKKVVHFITDGEMNMRLLEHFYSFIHFQDDRMDRYYKRFVRDYIHYIDAIFCKSALIIDRLLKEGDGSYTAFHIRRGDFQYKSIKIPAAQMLENVGEFIPKDSLIFLATDEKNKTFFDAFHQRYEKVRYLGDYFEYAGLKDINPNYLGMIDQVICSRGSLFVGTWFSTFSGYITRMRGYLGYHDYTVYYGDKEHRDRFQHDELPKFPFYMREWNVSWAGIDEVPAGNGNGISGTRRL